MVWCPTMPWIPRIPRARKRCLARDAASVEDEAIAHILRDRLHACLELLPSQEWELIQALYFEELSERDLARKTGVPQRTIHDRKKKAIAHLKKMLKI